MMVRLETGDCLDILRDMPDNSVDSVVTDPPYGISFMGKAWDHGVPGVEFWREILRVAKPGAHIVAFGGTRTYHRLAVAIEDAGAEIRDCFVWAYGTGFPKSHDVSKAIDEAAGAERELVSELRTGWNGTLGGKSALGGLAGKEDIRRITAPATDAARRWSGWGTALKPAWEPAVMARKPLIGTVAANVLAHGTGAINVDGCRVWRDTRDASGWSQSGSKASENRAMSGRNYAREAKPDAVGRWPANVIHDGSPPILDLFPREAYRFFYTAKASRADRGPGNTHPTVKPSDLMAYVCRLVTPPGGLVLDPFMGSGSTGIGAVRGGFGFIGIDKISEYVEIARRRIDAEEGAS